MRRAFTGSFRYVFLYFLFTLSAFWVFPALQSHSDTVSYNYDDLGRLIQETYEDGSNITYTYDELGNRLSKEVLVGDGAGITVTSPPGGAIVEAGTTATIQWTYRGNPGSAVRLELLKGGALNVVINADTPIGAGSTGSYTWSIPASQSPGNDYQIRVTSTTDSQYSDTTDGVFTIVAPTGIVVTSPNGGEQWQTGTTKTIQWGYNVGAGPSVRIELLKGGELSAVIAYSAPIGTGGTGIYSWQIPSGQTFGTDYKIRVTNTNNGSVGDTSNGDFAISQSAITVVTPNGGDSWPAGGYKLIKWSYFGNPGSYVKIELLKGGVLYSTIASSVPTMSGGSGDCYWAIPGNQAAGSDYRIRVTSTSNTIYTDTSNNDFAIVPGGITVSSPNGGNSLQSGTTQKISWSFFGDVGLSVKIELLKGGVLNSTIVSNAPIGTLGWGGYYYWTIPAGQVAGSDYRIRVTSTNNSDYTDTSDNNFTILSSSLTVGFNWIYTMQAGSTQTIDWAYTGNPGPSVKIELLKGGVPDSTIASDTSIGTGGVGYYKWTVPAEQAAGSNYRIRITSNSNSTFTDINNNNFTIFPTDISSIDSPYRDNWLTGTTRTIKWTYYGNPGSSVRIELLKGGILDSTIVTTTAIGAFNPNRNAYEGSYNWVIPFEQAAGADYAIRISSTSNSSYSETSVNFTISIPNAIAVAFPRGGESLLAGTTQTLRWSYSGNPGSPVTVELLKAGIVDGTVASNVSLGEGGNGSFTWTVPSNQTPGPDYQIRVRSTQYSDDSDSDFSITDSSAITLASLDNGEVFQAGTTQAIQWTYEGNPGSSVQIQLLKGGVVQSIISPDAPIGTGGSGSYNWTIPSGQANGNDYQIRINCGSYSDTSKRNFTIVPQLITISSPNGGNSLQAGTTQVINWTYSGNPGSFVGIELLKGGILNSAIKPSAPMGIGGVGSYRWDVPVDQATGSDYTVRVTSTSNSAYTDTSNSDFTILPTGITVTSPNGGNSLQAGTTQTINWNYGGNVGASVKIDLMKGGTLDSTITSSAPTGGAGSGYYYWAIPANQATGSDYTVRVTSTSNSAYTDTSNSNFTILPTGITVTSPNGGNSLQAGTIQRINWNYSGNPGTSVKIELLKGGSIVGTVGEDAPIGMWDSYYGKYSGSYDWAIPMDQASGTDYTVRVISMSNSTFSDASNSSFTIVPTGITLTSPNGGNSLQAGTRQAIQWTYTGDLGPSARIDLLKEGIVVNTIAFNASIGSGQLLWDIPSGLSGGSDYRIRITSNSYDSFYDSSNADFTIIPVRLSLTSPNGGEVLLAGSPKTITWTYTGYPGPSVRIELLKGGILKDLIVARTPLTSGSFTWLISSTQEIGADYQIRISSATDEEYTDTSDGTFTIQNP